jgi:hypothetical protein
MEVQNPVQKLESMVIRKTNRFVYFSDGTHMSYANFHSYKQDLRKELQLITATELKDSIEMVVTSLKEQQRLEEMLYTLQNNRANLNYEIDSLKQDDTDWEESFKRQRNENNKIQDKINDHASKLYANLSELPILKNYTNDKGIKFIIQRNYITKETRFCFDPYELGANFHSQLSEFFRQENWGTMNGGWMKVMNNQVILYKSSGDYGVYDDITAVTCARVLFPNENILSFAGREWNDISTSETL